MDGSPALDPISGALAGLEHVAQRAAVREARADEVAEAAAARERRARATRTTTMVSALILAIIAVVVSVLSANTRANDVAERVSPAIAAQVVGEARAARVATGRAALGEANARLLARQLPTVPDPGDGATGDELVIAAATARVLAYLPETYAEALRADVAAGRTPRVLPSVLIPIPGPDGSGGDRVVEVLPSLSPDRRNVTPRTATPPSSSSPARPNPPSGSAPTGPDPAPPATTPPRRGLLPLLPDLPIRVPLLSQ